MKKILFIILLVLSFVSYANAGSVIGNWYASAASWPDFSYDIWIDYETEAGTDCDDTHLEATDNSASSYTYTLSDASSELNCRDTGAEYNGTQGMSYDYTGGAAGYTAIAISGTSVSGGFWFYGPDLNNWQRISFVWVKKGSGDYACSINWKQDSGSEYLEVTNGTSPDTNTSVSHSTWYWITFSTVKNSTCDVTVYNTSESTVGSEISTNVANEDLTGIWWGAPSVSGSKAVSSYIDDFCLDTTDYTYPLGDGQ